MTEPAIDTTWIDHMVGYRLRRASAAMAADYAATAGPGRLRPVLVSMLSLVEANPGIGQSALGGTLGIQRANVVPLVAELNRRALVERRSSPTDGRRIELHLTRDGELALEDGRRLIADHEARMTAALNERERATLLDLLGRVVDAGTAS